MDSIKALLDRLPPEEEWKAKLTQVSDMVKLLDEKANALYDRYPLKGPQHFIDPEPKDIMEVLKNSRRYFQIGRAQERAGIFYGEILPVPRVLPNRMASPFAPINSCKIQIKLLFLKHSDEVFRGYLAHIKETLQAIPRELATADLVIRELRALFALAGEEKG